MGTVSVEERDDLNILERSVRSVAIPERGLKGTHGSAGGSRPQL